MRLQHLPNQFAPFQRFADPYRFRLDGQYGHSGSIEQLFLERHEQRFVDQNYGGECRYREWNGFLFRIGQHGWVQDGDHDHWRADFHR